MKTQPSASELKQLQSALLESFSHTELIRLVRVQLGENLEWFTPVRGNLTTIVDELVAYFASRQGGLKLLLDAAVDENPGSQTLTDLQSEWAKIQFAQLALPLEHPSIQISGDLVMGSKNIAGDEVLGDKIAGDKVINLGEEAYNISGLENPYIGLAAFTYNEHERFAGRKTETKQALSILTEPGDQRSLLFINGSSGSGKSSFAQAGLLPKLQEHYELQNVDIKWAVFRPGKHPIRRLNGIVQNLGLNDDQLFRPSIENQSAHIESKLVYILIVDQFEEVFSQSEPHQRAEFLSLLTRLPKFSQNQLHVIATMRTDYLPDLFEEAQLYANNRNGIDLRVMNATELAEAIQQPLWTMHKDKGKRFQDELLSELITDASNDSTLLPLLQVTLEELWRNGQLISKNYGNLSDAISNRATEVYEYRQNDHGRKVARSEDEQETILNIFLGLVDVVEVEQKRFVRRPRALNDILKIYPDARSLIDEFTTARLLSISTTESSQNDDGQQVQLVDIIHESLFANWPILTKAIELQQEQLRQRNRFEQNLNLWQSDGKVKERLLQGIQLAEAEELNDRDDVALQSDLANEFVSQSVRERERVRRRNQRIAIAVASILGALLVVAIVAVYFTGQARDDAVLARNDALSRGLAAEARTLFDDQPDLAYLLSSEAYNVADTVESKSSLLYGFQRNPYLRSYLRAHNDWVRVVALSRDSMTLASGDRDGTIILWDLDTNQKYAELNDPRLSGDVRSIAFSPDGNLLAASTSSDKDKGGGHIAIWDLSLQTPGLSAITDITGKFSTLQFTSDGRSLLSAHNGEVYKWESDLSKHSKILFVDMLSNITSMVFSPDSNRIVIGDDVGEITVSDINSSSTLTLTTNNKPINSLAINKGNTLLAAVGSNNNINLWSLDTNQVITLTGHTDQVQAVAFTPNDETLISASRDESIILWDLETYTPRTEPLNAHSDWILSLAVGNDARTFASGGADNNVMIWNQHSEPAIKILEIAHNDEVWSTTFSSDGNKLVSAGKDTNIIVYDFDTTLSIVLESHTHPVRSVAIDPNNSLLASGDEHGDIIFWQLGQEIRELSRVVHSENNFIGRLLFSPDGKILLSTSQNAPLKLWDMSTSPPSALINEVEIRNSLAEVWTVDGEELLAARNDGTITKLNLMSFDVISLNIPEEEISVMSFSQDARWVAWGNEVGKVAIWDLDNNKIIARFSHQSGHISRALRFSSDNHILASGTDDGDILIWDTQLNQEIGRSIDAHTMPINMLAISNDGRYVASASDDQTMAVWDVTTESWLNFSCQISQRNLSHQEWAQYLGSLTYRSTCSDKIE